MTVLIAGGGIAGAVAAILLGPRATLLEREPGPHDKVCGEFISWEAHDALRTLGVDPATIGAQPIDTVRLIHRATTISTPLPAQGLSLSRRTLDDALLTRAEHQGATIHRGHTVRRLTPTGLEADDLPPLHAQSTLLATGKHDLRGARRNATPEPIIGLKMYYRLTQAEAEHLARHVEVILFPGGYAGLQPVEHGRANLCLLIRQQAFSEAGANWDGVTAHLTRHSPHLARRLAHATPLLDRPLAIARIPYGFVHSPTELDPPNIIRLGDQMGVIPSFSGDGMAIALHTAFAATQSLDAPTHHRRMHAHLAPQIARAMLLHHAGQRTPTLLTAAARLWPGALAHIARLTRVPPATLAWTLKPS